MSTPKIRAIRSAVSAALIAIVLCASPSMALAKAPVPADYAVQLVAEMEQGSLGAIAVATIPEKTPLPATVRIMVPKGFHPNWVGEIMGSDTTQDTQVEYTEGTTEQGSYLEVTATKSRTIQAEGLVHGGLAYDGEKTVITTSITNPAENPSALELTLVVPPAAGAPSGDPEVTAGPNVDASGKKLYNLAPTSIAGNQTISINESYETNGGANGTGPASQNAALPIAIVVVIAIILGAGIFFLVRKKRSEEIYY